MIYLVLLVAGTSHYTVVVGNNQGRVAMTAYIPGNPLLYWSGKLLGNGGAIGLGYTIGTNAPIGYIVLGVACWLVGGLLSSINVRQLAQNAYSLGARL